MTTPPDLRLLHKLGISLEEAVDLCRTVDGLKPIPNPEFHSDNFGQPKTVWARENGEIENFTPFYLIHKEAANALRSKLSAEEVPAFCQELAGLVLDPKTSPNLYGTDVLAILDANATAICLAVLLAKKVLVPNPNLLLIVEGYEALETGLTLLATAGPGATKITPGTTIRVEAKGQPTSFHTIAKVTAPSPSSEYYRISLQDQISTKEIPVGSKFHLSL